MTARFTAASAIRLAEVNPFRYRLEKDLIPEHHPVSGDFFAQLSHINKTGRVSTACFIYVSYAFPSSCSFFASFSTLRSTILVLIGSQCIGLRSNHLELVNLYSRFGIALRMGAARNP